MAEQGLILILGLLVGAAVGGFFWHRVARKKQSLLDQALQTKDSQILQTLELTAEQKARVARLEAELESSQRENDSLRKQQSNQEVLTKQMAEKFELLASRIFEDKSTKFSDQNIKQLSQLLEPFRDKLKDFEKKVEDTYSTERAERGSLRGELSRLMDLNLKMTVEAENLTRALKGDNKASGNWGEMILESLLERSGLRKGEEYSVQDTHRNDEGHTIRPDVILNLPDGKHVIIDSKVSLTAYDSYIASETDEHRETFAKAHLESLKRHIDGLAGKKYHSADTLISPDFVILFMPIEPAFALAFKLKPDLLDYAWQRSVALVSPTTLLTTLRTVSALWKTERQERNALEIAKRGGALYDKFAGLVEDMIDLGRKLETTQKTHAGVMNKLTDGNGNLVRQVEMLKELGAKTERKISLNAPKEL